MRLIICGDTHIGAVLGLGKPNGNGGNTRVDDYESTLNYIADYAISTKADAFIQTGDVFDVRNPEPEHIEVVNRCIRKLSGAGITSIWIMGNHDYKRSGDSFTSAITSLAAKDYPNTRIVLKPEVIEVTSGHNDRASIVLMPYRDRRMYNGNSCESDSYEYEREAEELINGCDSNNPIVAVGHNFFFEGSYHHYGGAEVLVGIEAFKKCDMVAMGHHHHFRILNNKAPMAFYTGSMEKLNFGDSKIDKYFADYDTKSKKVVIKKSPSRVLIDNYISLENADYSNLYKRIEDEVRKIAVKDSVVRVKIAIKDTLISSVKKTDIQKILYENGAFYVSKILLDPIYKKINKDHDILDEKTDFNMFEAFLKKQDLSDDIKEDILKEARKVIK